MIWPNQMIHFSSGQVDWTEQNTNRSGQVSTEQVSTEQVRTEQVRTEQKGIHIWTSIQQYQYSSSVVATREERNMNNRTEMGLTVTSDSTSDERTISEHRTVLGPEKPFGFQKASNLLFKFVPEEIQVRNSFLSFSK